MINYEINTYECDEFIDGVTIADKLNQSYDMSFKTLVTVGKSKNYYVFVIPVDKELDMKKAANAVGEKKCGNAPREGYQCCNRIHQRRMYTNWNEKAI